MNTQTTLPVSKIKLIEAQGHAIIPVKTPAEALVKAGKLFAEGGVYYTALTLTTEVSEGGNVVFSVHPNLNPQLKHYFII